MKIDMPLINHIEERTLEEIKSYYRPEEFIEYCKECQYYNKIWTCPPYDTDMTKMLKNYQYVYIIGSKLYIDDLGESFRELMNNNDLEYVSNEIYKSARMVIDEKLEAVGDQKEGLGVLLAGRCLVCSQCTREKQLPCSYPEKTHLSLESIGFDVASICEDVLGDKIKWAKESLPEYFILVSAVLSQKKLCIEDIDKVLSSKKHT